jgi:hypothetical protein
MSNDVGRLRRVAGWEERLEALWLARQATPFTWGVHDCCMWAADVVQAVTGVDLAGEQRGQYDSAETGAVVLAEVGGVLGLAWTRLSPVADLVPIALATAGDVGVVQQGGAIGHTLVVNVGDRWVGPGEVGLVEWPAARVLLCWCVGGA